MEKRRLSAIGTFFLKFILPAIWLGVCGQSLFGIYPDDEYIIPLALGIIGLVFTLPVMGTLKKVYLRGDELIISNYFKTITIPVSAIIEISESYFFSPKLIWIHLKGPTPFGWKIKFMPIIYGKDLFCLFTSHSLVKELRELAGLRD